MALIILAAAAVLAAGAWLLLREPNHVHLEEPEPARPVIDLKAAVDKAVADQLHHEEHHQVTVNGKPVKPKVDVHLRRRAVHQRVQNHLQLVGAKATHDEVRAHVHHHEHIRGRK